MLLLEYKKIKSISNDLIDLLLENNLENIIDDLKNSKDSKDYFDLSYSDRSKISYLKGDRIPENEDLLYDTYYRESKAYHTKIGKLLSDNISQYDVQRISKIMYTRESEFNLSITDKICHYYNENNYSQDHGINGQLHNSCMRYDSLESAIRLYENMGNHKVQLLIVLDHNDLLIARALLWHDVDYNNDKIKYLDRIYSANDNVSQLLSDYADQNGILKYGESHGELRVNIDIDGDDYIPYFDTFNHYSHSGYLSSTYADIEFSSTEGESMNDIDSQECYECNSRFDRDDLFYSECDNCHYCGDCGIWIDDYVYNINQCVQVNDTWYHKESDKIVYSEHQQEYLESENAIYIDSENDYFDSDSNDIVYSEYNGDYMLLENATYSEYHEDYFDRDDVIYSKFHEDYFLDSDSGIVVSKYHDDLLIKDDDNVVYIESENDYFLIDDDCIYYDDDKNIYCHRQYTMAL